MDVGAKLRGLLPGIGRSQQSLKALRFMAPPLLLLLASALRFHVPALRFPIRQVLLMEFLVCRGESPDDRIELDLERPVRMIPPFILDSAVGVRNEPYAVDFFGISTAPQFTKSVKTHCGTNSYESCACPCSSDFNCRI